MISKNRDIINSIALKNVNTADHKDGCTVLSPVVAEDAVLG